jgi:hypothetical protein
VIVEGTCRVIRQDIEDMAMSISVRYYGEQRGRDYVTEALTTPDSVIVEIEPARILTERSA